MIPEEDRGPAWLRDTSYVDFGNIEADLAAMEDFAKRLSTEVEINYDPHVQEVTGAMLTELPYPAETFPELVNFMTAHNEAQNIAQQNVWNFSRGTSNFARAAHTISKEYRGSDAFSEARVKDVDKALNTAASDTGENV